MDLPLILSSPHPRSLDMIFTDAARARLQERYRIVEVAADRLDTLPEATLAETRYVLGQPPIPAPLLAHGVA